MKTRFKRIILLCATCLLLSACQLAKETEDDSMDVAVGIYVSNNIDLDKEEVKVENENKDIHIFVENDKGAGLLYYLHEDCIESLSVGYGVNDIFTDVHITDKDNTTNITGTIHISNNANKALYTYIIMRKKTGEMYLDGTSKMMMFDPANPIGGFSQNVNSTFTRDVNGEGMEVTENITLNSSIVNESLEMTFTEMNDRDQKLSEVTYDINDVPKEMQLSNEESAYVLVCRKEYGENNEIVYARDILSKQEKTYSYFVCDNELCTKKEMKIVNK